MSQETGFNYLSKKTWLRAKIPPTGNHATAWIKKTKDLGYWVWQRGHGNSSLEAWP
jgi:hypothetical protein